MKSLSALLLTATLGIASAQETRPAPQLMVGDPAPALTCGKFVQGEEVKEFSKDNAYIIEFWATWCGPCVATIPHVNEIQNKFKDQGLIVIGLNLGEDEATVEPFIKKMGAKMSYRVALDDNKTNKAGAMSTDWMLAAAQKTIPCAFIVGKDQKLAWVGHPGQMSEKMISDILAGTYDAVAAAKAAAEAKSQAAEHDSADAAKRKEISAAQLSLGKAIREKDWTTAESSLAKFSDMLNEQQRKFIVIPKLQILLGQKKLDEANTLAAKISADNADSLGMQYQVGNALLNAVAEDKANVALAEKIARKALEVSEGPSKPMCQALLAKALFLSGKQDEAVQLQSEATDALPEGRRAPFQKVLDAYKDGKMPTTEKL
jgi:thiol-disulfide isomerase/thioredoxin